MNQTLGLAFDFFDLIIIRVQMRFIILISTLICGFLPSFMAAADTWADCTNSSAELAIQACSQIISEKRVDRINLSIAHSNRGNAYLRLAQNQQALQDFNRAIEIDPTNARAFQNRGNFYFMSEKYDEAISNYDQAIRSDPSYDRAHVNRGLAFLQQEKYAEAIRNFDAALKLNPDSAPAYNNRGAAYQQSGEKNRAIEDYKKALAIDPRFQTARENLQKLGVPLN